MQDFIVDFLIYLRHLSSNESSLFQDESFSLKMWLKHTFDKVECLLDLKWFFNQLKYSFFD